MNKSIDYENKINCEFIMNLTEEQNDKLEQVIEKLSRGDSSIKESPSTRVMAVNLLISFKWDIEMSLDSLS